MKIKRFSRFIWWLLFSAIAIHLLMIGRVLYIMDNMRLINSRFGLGYVELTRDLELTDGLRRAEKAIRIYSLKPSSASRAVYCKSLRDADRAAAAAASAGAYSGGAGAFDLAPLRASLVNDLRRCASPPVSLPDRNAEQEEFAAFFDLASRLPEKISAHSRTRLEASLLLSQVLREKTVELVVGIFAIATVILLLMLWAAYSLRRLNKDVVRQRNEILVLKEGLEQSSLGVALTDTTGNIEYINPAFTTMHGYSSVEAVGKNIRFLESGGTPAALYQTLWKTLRSGLPWTGQFDNRTKSGELLGVRANMSPVRDSEGIVTNFIALYKDVTLEKQLMAEVVEAKREAEQANQTKSYFLAAMSHEIRTPLNAIVGMLELLDEAKLNKEQAQYVSIMRNASETLISLINDILDISKIEAGKVEIERLPFNLEELVSEVLELMSVRAFKKNLEINSKIAPDVPVFVEGDAMRLRQVLINLLGNAVKFVEKGWISLDVKTQKADGDRLELLFSVRDTGIGIPADKQASIFEKFSQADASTTRKYGGTGLGLPISKMLVELMGGKIWVESEPGVGTVFHFTAGLWAQKDKRAVYLPKADIKELKGRRFLAVDDNQVNRIIIRDIAQSWGSACECAAGGEDGLAKVLEEQRKGAPFNGVFVDFNMPGMDGYEFCRRLMADASISPKPALALTASDAIRLRKEDFRAIGVHTYIMKPVKKQTLLDGALEMLAGGKAAPAAAPQKAPLYAKEDLPALAALVVDDSEDNRILISSFLKGSKVRLELAVDGFDALEKFRTGTYDIVFMDIQMPEMDGFETTVKLRGLEASEKRARTKVVALTAMAMHEDVDRAVKAGCDDYLTKPLRKNTFYAYLVGFAAGRAKPGCA